MWRCTRRGTSVCGIVVSREGLLEASRVVSRCSRTIESAAGQVFQGEDETMPVVDEEAEIEVQR